MSHFINMPSNTFSKHLHPHFLTHSFLLIMYKCKSELAVVCRRLTTHACVQVCACVCDRFTLTVIHTFFLFYAVCVCVCVEPEPEEVCLQLFIKRSELTRLSSTPQERRALERKISEMEEELKVPTPDTHTHRHTQCFMFSVHVDFGLEDFH